ncbi:HAMP domain-containing histidine kinase [Sporosarcina aquimarina]|uniref:sensor histidine kinase n=1 Tax=Sporosarcina aquimarina TaxID=114975 RepID=UPI00203CD7FC|nr:ATP-binding protein [Sporosarcina aquimarina]MCM3758714.1 HAMP domain-containing histidine kinase [Sporosarcina aquimarina]
MFNKQIFKKQQLKFMLFNLLAFTVIFTIFSIIILGQVQNTLFTKTDQELLLFKEMMTDTNSKMLRLPRKDGDLNQPDDERQKNKPNPRVIVIHWDSTGNILNKNEVGTTFYENYLEDYKLDKTHIDKITTTKISELYQFRYILFEDPNEQNEIAYTQLMINVDAEQTIISNFEKLIIICSIIFIVLSISASYLLSRKMMKPIMHSWNKQAEFVENASHELRTPLTIIQNKLELLLTAPQDRISDRFENIAQSLSETRRLSKLTSDLLTLARADSAETQIVKQSVDVDTFIQKVCTPYKEIAESQEKHFSLECKSPLTIEADDTRLHQLVVILLDNALKYTGEDDSIRVKTYVEDQKVVIEVSDTGIGIKEESIPHIFDRFYRGDKARTRETGGMGLGLSIAQWIATIHNGTIHVISNQQKGTTFKVKLPK